MALANSKRGSRLAPSADRAIDIRHDVPDSNSPRRTYERSTIRRFEFLPAREIITERYPLTWVPPQLGTRPIVKQKLGRPTETADDWR